MNERKYKFIALQLSNTPGVLVFWSLVSTTTAVVGRFALTTTRQTGWELGEVMVEQGKRQARWAVCPTLNTLVVLKF